MPAGEAQRALNFFLSYWSADRPQAKLLRALEERAFEPVGSNKSQPVRACLIAASIRPLDKELEAGRDQFFAYCLQYSVGATVAAADFEGTGKDDILTGAAQGAPAYRVVRGDASGIQPPALFEGIASDFQGGITVGA